MSCREGSDGEGEAVNEEGEEEDDESGCMTNRFVQPPMLSHSTGSGVGWGGGFPGISKGEQTAWSRSHCRAHSYLSTPGDHDGCQSVAG